MTEDQGPDKLVAVMAVVAAGLFEDLGRDMTATFMSMIQSLAVS